MRFFVAPLLAVSLFMAADANAFFGAFARTTGGMANINSGTCNNPADGLWGSYCSGFQPSTNYSYGSGFGAYAYQIPPAPASRCCGQRSVGAWFGGGGCGGGGCGSSCGLGRGSSCGASGCGSSCGLGGLGAGFANVGHNVGNQMRSMFSRLRCQCCSAGNCWVGGSPIMTSSCAAQSTVSFDGGVDYGYINSCSEGGCGGGCGCSGGGDVVGDMGGEVIMHSEGAVIGEPTPAVGVPMEGAIIDGGAAHSM